MKVTQEFIDRTPRWGKMLILGVHATISIGIATDMVLDSIEYKLFPQPTINTDIRTGN